MVATADVEVRHLPEQTVAYQQFRGTIASLEAAITAVRSWVVTMGYHPQGPLAIQITGEPGDDPLLEYDIEVQLPVEEDTRASPADLVQVKRLEPADAAVLTLHGPADLIHVHIPFARLQQWLRERGIQAPAVLRWVEVTDPTKVTAEQQVTELQYLVRPGRLATAETQQPAAARRMATTGAGAPRRQDATPQETRRIAPAVATPPMAPTRPSAVAAVRDRLSSPQVLAAGLGMAMLVAATVGVLVYRRRRSGQRRPRSVPALVRRFAPDTQSLRRLLRRSRAVPGFVRRFM